MPLSEGGCDRGYRPDPPLPKNCTVVRRHFGPPRHGPHAAVFDRRQQAGKRFPWGDTISHSQANYRAGKSPYQLGGEVNGHHPAYATDGYLYTSPVGSFAANGYGLFDMAGNVSQWCWDWYGDYGGADGVTDPRGPATGSFRILRGGNWNQGAFRAKCGLRVVAFPSLANSNVGFRVARRQINGAERRSSSDAGAGN